jgi:voltage-gated potassium channel
LFLALATLEAERYAPGANIVTFGDAIWWALVTIATVGYGDTYPVTALGRFYAVLLMAGGVAIVGTASATIISFLNERVAGLRRHGDTLAAPPSLSTGEEQDPTALPTAESPTPVHADDPERPAGTAG